MADTKTKTATKVRDVVCGKEVDPDTAQFTVTHQGVMYYFDSAECKTAFQEDPEMYVPAGDGKT